MEDQDLTQEQVARELERLRRRVKELEESEARLRGTEKALKESEEKYRTLFEESFDGLFITCPEGRILDMNRKGVAMFGYDTKEEILSLDLERNVYAHPPDRKRILAMVNARGTAEYEVVVKKKNREEMVTHCSLTAVRDDKGTIVSYRGIIRDITERNRQEGVRLARLDLLEFADAHTLEELLQATLDKAEALTGSRIGFYHFLEADQETLSLQAWSSNTIHTMCTAEGKGLHYNISEAGVWVDCIRERRAVVHNDYSALPHRKGLPPGHAQVVRELVIPVFRGNRVVAILGVGNKPADYAVQDVSTVSWLADLAWDIAERKLAQDALRASEARFRQLYDEAPMAMYASNRQGEIVTVNSKCLQILGLDRKEVLGRRPEAFLASESKKRLPEIREAFWSEGGTSEIPLQIVKRDGSVRDIIADSVALEDPLWGRMGFTVFRDVTEHKHAERELQKSNDLLRAIIEAAPTAIIGLDLDGNVRAVWNPAAEKMLGWSAQEVMGRPLPSVPVESQDQFRRFRETIRSGKTLDGVEVRRQKRGGIPIDYSIYASPLHDAEGRITGNICVLVDITERKRVEEELRQYRTHLEDLVRERTEQLQERSLELEAANARLWETDRLKSVFLASMSHELRTPLNSIIGFTGIMLLGLAGELTEEQERQLKMVKNSADHLLGLINDVLDIAKIEAGKVTLLRERFELEEVVASVLETFVPLAAEKGLELIRDLPSRLPLVSDKRRVKQILMNIIGNAVKFTDQGSVKVSAKAVGDDTIELRFADTGIGIKEEDMKKLFFPFQQIDTSLTKAHEGTGLGLYLCKRLTSLLGGDIRVSSTYGQGSEFTVILPLVYRGPHGGGHETDLGS